MDCYPSNRSWMYDRLYPGRRGLKQSFINRVEEFVIQAKRQQCFIYDGGIRCPCIKCQCRKIKSDDVVKTDLYIVGFMNNYWIWTDHGEEVPHVEKSGSLHAGGSYNQAQHVDRPAREYGLGVQT